MKALPPDPTPPRRKLTRSLKVMAFAKPVSKPFKSLFNRLFPLGYEDEKGFHYEEQKRQM
jgi:hypothetical protein